ncbi:MAG: XRE family transcriptional regulator [Eubacterium sp.]|nr:XRE family transcriptional regulator [Eubacterium sp.]
MSIGERIKEKRLSLGLTQEDLAKRMGYKSKSTINKIELGINDIPQSKVSEFADALCTSTSFLMGLEKDKNEQRKVNTVRIPVLGMVHAGYPTDAIEDILDWEEITSDMASRGEIMALQIKGDCMEPKFSEGDVVIVLCQSHVETGDIAIIMVNHDEAEMRKIKRFEDGSINLIPLNPAYQVKSYSPKEIEELPIHVLGKVIELRCKF